MGWPVKRDATDTEAAPILGFLERQMFAITAGTETV